MKKPSKQKHDPLDLIIECTFTVRAGDHHFLGKAGETICLPFALQASQLDFANENVQAAMRCGPMMHLQQIVRAEVRKRSVNSVAKRLDITHPDWATNPDLEEEDHYVRKLLDHLAQEMQIAEED